MKRLRYVFSRRRAHPVPTWRDRPVTPPIDVRLAELHTQADRVRPPEVLDMRDEEEPRGAPNHPIWER